MFLFLIFFINQSLKIELIKISNTKFQVLRFITILHYVKFFVYSCRCVYDNASCWAKLQHQSPKYSHLDSSPQFLHIRPKQPWKNSPLISYYTGLFEVSYNKIGLADMQKTKHQCLWHFIPGNNLDNCLCLTKSARIPDFISQLSVMFEMHQGYCWLLGCACIDWNWARKGK